MRRVLILIAIAQSFVLCWLIHSRVGDVTASLSDLAARDYDVYPVRQIYRFEASGVDVSGITPGFVEGYIVAKFQKEISITTTYRNLDGWTLDAEVDGNEVSVTSQSLDEACLEVLHECHEKLLAD